MLRDCIRKLRRQRLCASCGQQVQPVITYLQTALAFNLRTERCPECDSVIKWKKVFYG